MKMFFFCIFFFFAIPPVFAAGPTDETKAAEDRWKLDFGGQVRIRGDFAENQNFTDFTFTPGQKEAQFLERTRLYGFVEDPSLNLKVYAHIQWYGRWGAVNERSDLDLYQGYAEWDKPFGLPMGLKVGRQDFSYGSTFFLGPNDFYNGLSWDGIKVGINPSGQLSTDLIGAQMAKLNHEDPDIFLTGFYSTYRLDKEKSLEAYLFYNEGGFPFLHREFKVQGSGQQWFTLGVRFAGKRGRFDYELEPQVQWGKVKNPISDSKDDIRAYGGHLDLGYTFEFPWGPRIFAAYAHGSGDDDPFDGKVTQFHGNIFNDNYLVGDMSMIGDLSGVTVGDVHASGIRVFVGGISFNPLSNLNLNLDVHRFAATNGAPGFSKDLGVEVNLAASYKLTKGISFLAGLNRFFTGRFFEQAVGSTRNIDYAYIQGQVGF